MLKLRASIFITLFLLLPFSIGYAAAVPQTAMINGKVENQTISGKGVSGLEIKLLQFMENKETVIGRTKTDATGSFSFQQIKADKSAIYAVSAMYGDIAYFSEPIQLKDTKISQTKLMIYETTDQATGIHVQMHHIIFEKGANAYMVKEVLIVENPGKRTFSGDRDIKPGQKAGFQIQLPAEATGIEYAPPLVPIPAKQEKVVSLTAPLTPGITELLFTYAIPSSGANYNFLKVINLKTDAMSVVLPAKGLQVKSDQLVAETGASSQKKFKQLSGKDFSEGAKVKMVLSFSSDIDYFKWGVVALMLLVLGTGLTIASLKKKQRAVNENVYS